MTCIKWLPSELLDEVVPPSRDTPSDWIDRTSASEPFLILGDDEESETPKLLRDGEIVMFCSVTDHGTGTLTIENDHGWMVVPDMPAAAETCCILDGWQSVTIAGDVDECAKLLFEENPGAGDYRISYYTWSGEQPFVFDAATGSFRAQPTQATEA